MRRMSDGILNQNRLNNPMDKSKSAIQNRKS